MTPIDLAAELRELREQHEILMRSRDGWNHDALINAQNAGKYEFERDAARAEVERLAAENASLRAALRDAATSLSTLGRAGRWGDELDTMSEVRGYANSRARVADAALKGETT